MLGTTQTPFWVGHSATQGNGLKEKGVLGGSRATSKVSTDGRIGGGAAGMDPVELLCGVRYVAWRACREGADVHCGHSCELQLLFGAVVLQFPDSKVLYQTEKS